MLIFMGNSMDVDGKFMDVDGKWIDPHGSSWMFMGKLYIICNFTGNWWIWACKLRYGKPRICRSCSYSSSPRVFHIYLDLLKGIQQKLLFILILDILIWECTWNVISKKYAVELMSPINLCFHWWKPTLNGIWMDFPSMSCKQNSDTGI